MTRVSMAGLVGVLTVSWAVGCSSPPPPPPPDTGSEFTEAPVAPTPPSMPVRVTVELGTVYFDFDRAEIRGDARPILRGNANEMGDAPGVVTIEGNTDERGSSEYNLALGERRARSVKRYLVDLGVSSSKMRTVSFGEDRPAVQGHDESAWRYNRRADFNVGN